MSPHPAPEPHPLEGKLEPECRGEQTPLECAALSIAITPEGRELVKKALGE